MSTRPLSTSFAITVLKPVAEVFRAVLTPVPYFLAKASGPLAEGARPEWTFPEMPNAGFPVRVLSVTPNRRIQFEWESQTGGENLCEFLFAELDGDGKAAALRHGLAGKAATTVTVTESGWPDTEAGRTACLLNTSGWTHMLCSLKAWLEHGANLRTGAFLHYKFPA